MKVNILISGPLRPTVDTTLYCIENIKEQFPEATLYLSTWSGQEHIERVKNIVDYYIETDEPTPNELSSNKFNNFSHVSFYNYQRMFIGINRLFDFIDAGKLIDEKDIVIRLRTDAFVKIEENTIDIIKITDFSNLYLLNLRHTSGVKFCDWFGISSYRNMKLTWKYFEPHYNPESILKTNLEKNNVEFKYFETVSFPSHIPEIYPLHPNEISVYKGSNILNPNSIEGTKLEEICIIRDNGKSHMP
jgi:hypothetical protein